MVFAAADPYGEDKPLNLPAESGRKVADVGGSGGGLARTFVGLAVVVAVIYGLSWVLRQVKSSREERTTGFGLGSEGMIPLGPNRAVHLIRAGRELVLVGSAEHGVVPIRTYSEDEARRLGLIAPAELESGEVMPANGSAPAKPSMRSVLDAIRQRTVR